MNYEEGMKLASEFISCNCEECYMTKRETVKAWISNKKMRLPYPTTCIHGKQKEAI